MARNTVQQGRFTATMEDEFVLFVIGMRFNKLWKVHKWMAPFVAMPKMLRQLAQHPEKGLLGARMAIGGRTITVIQYWRSFEQLEAFAKNPEDSHLPAWRAFNQSVGKNGDVGIYHETYRVAPGQHNSIYSNMPVMGLAAAGSSTAVGRGSSSKRERLGSGAEPQP